MIQLRNIRCELTEEISTEKIAKILNIQKEEILSWRLSKKAIDARKKQDIFYCCSIDISIKKEARFYQRKDVSIIKNEPLIFPKAPVEFQRPVVIGSGPAGLFATYMLAKNGYRPILLERGAPIEERIKAVQQFWENGIFSPISNVQFGEGGAGTFSDGKLTTGIKDSRCRTVLETFVEHGAPNEILYLAKPHIGTDLLSKTVKNMRESIIKNGGEVHFYSKVTDFLIKQNQIVGLIINDQEQINANQVILAIGHSARDTVRSLYKLGIPMEQKPFSVGSRIEHEQSMINFAQYGNSARLLGAADYKLSTHLPDGRGVYTFCMCPGGVVVASASEEGGLVTNGMSYFNRSGKNSNSALLVSVNQNDFTDKSPLAGIAFQEEIERKAFLLGGKNYHAPIQLVGDFLNRRASTSVGNILPTYLPGVKPTDISELFPDFITTAMRQGILAFNQKLKGFANEYAILTAPETRSSSPVRILRDSESLQTSVEGLYPCGEGAGYAGGIMSAAVDGIRCAQQVAEVLKK